MREAPASFIHSGDVNVAGIEVTGNLNVRMKVPVLLTGTGLCHVAPLSVETVAKSAPHTLKSFQETYIRP
jgi:hypothetical protein